MTDVLEMASYTDPGRIRQINEDSVAFDEASGFAILADGMGGYNAGEVASGIAVSMILAGIKEAFSRPDSDGDDVEKVLRDQVDAANVAIYRASQSKEEYSGMGTTLVAALFYDNKVNVAHLGDSRLYRFRQEKLDLLTKDHSFLQEQLDRGIITREEARISQHKNLVTRAMGVDPAVEAEIGSYGTLPNDIYVLCSDGLNDMVDDEEIRFTLQVLQSNVKLAAEQLVELANQNGGKDNVSVVLVKVRREFPAQRSFVAKIRSLFRK